MKIVAYGSLMSQDSLTGTLGRNATLNKLEVPGYQRIFNAPFDGYAFLNLARSRAACIQAAWFEIDDDELTLFAVRESGSQLLEVAPGYFAFVWTSQFTQELPALQSYIDLCRAGAATLSINFDQGLILPRRVICDVLDPLYR